MPSIRTFLVLRALAVIGIGLLVASVFLARFAGEGRKAAPVPRDQVPSICLIATES